MGEVRSVVTRAESPPAPSTFSSYSWPVAAIGVKAGAQPALVGAWLIWAQTEVERGAAQLLAGETPVDVTAGGGAGG